MTETGDTNRRGRSRRRRKSSEIAAYLSAFKTSGQTIREFCGEHGISRSTFTAWQCNARAAERPLGKAVEKPSFARVELAAAASSLGITLVVRDPRGVEAELFGLDAATAVQVMRTVLTRSGR